MKSKISFACFLVNFSAFFCFNFSILRPCIANASGVIALDGKKYRDNDSPFSFNKAIYIISPLSLSSIIPVVSMSNAIPICVCLSLESVYLINYPVLVEFCRLLLHSLGDFLTEFSSLKEAFGNRFSSLKRAFFGECSSFFSMIWRDSPPTLGATRF